MPGAVGSIRQQRRVLRASFPPPGSAAGGAGLVAIGGAGLASWAYADPTLSWLWCGHAAMAAVFLGLATSQLIASAFEPMVAILGRELERAPDRKEGISGRRALGRGERRRMASARVDPSQARLLAGFYLLGGAGFLVAWLVQTRSPRPAATFFGLVAIATMVFGYGLIEYFRWQTLIAATRNDLGAERVARMWSASATQAPPLGPQPTVAERRTIPGAPPGARLLRVATGLGLLVCAIEIVLAWLAWRANAGPGLFLLACGGIAVAGGVAGYAAATARWRPLVAALGTEREPQRGALRGSGGRNELEPERRRDGDGSE